MFGTTIAMVKFDAQMATVCLFPSSGGAAVQSRRAPAPRFQLPQSCILMPGLLEASLAIASIGYPLIFRLCTKRRETACVGVPFIFCADKCQHSLHRQRNFRGVALDCFSVGTLYLVHTLGLQSSHLNYTSQPSFMVEPARCGLSVKSTSNKACTLRTRPHNLTSAHARERSTQ